MMWRLINLINHTSNLAEKLLPKDHLKSLLCKASNRQKQQKVASARNILFDKIYYIYSFGPWGWVNDDTIVIFGWVNYSFNIFFINFIIITMEIWNYFFNEMIL